MSIQQTNSIMPFTHEQFGQVRVIRDEAAGEPWFVAKDVAEALDIRTDTVRAILDAVDVKETNPNRIGVAPGGRNPLIISEPGLYALVFRSRKPEAAAFTRWITHEVIPAIRDEATGEPWFVAKDVAQALGYERPENAVATHCKHSKKVRLGYSPKQGGTPFITIIPKGDVYRLITRSKLPGAERFESWVFDEVLVSIDNHGGYLIDRPAVIVAQDTLERMKNKLQATEAELALAQPKAQLVDATFASRHEQPMKLTDVVRKLAGVNTIKIKSDLERR